MALASYTFVTVDDVKSYLDETSSTWNTVIESLINQFTQYAMNYCGGRSFIVTAEDVVEYFDGAGQQNLWLKHWPIVSVSDIAYASGDFNARTWTLYSAATDFIVDSTLGIIRHIGLPSGYQNIRVRYKGGYANAAAVPNDLKLAVIKGVADEFNKRKSQGISNESVGGGSISWKAQEALNPLLDNYRRFFPV